LATTDLWKPLARSHCGSQANLQSHRKLEELNFLQNKKQKCQHPKDLKGKSIFSIDPENFKCGMFS
jgi:hypothetical protein